MYRFEWKQFLVITLITSLWVNASEIFRYFVLVIPRVKEYWDDRVGIAEMDAGIFAIWGLWDSLLTAMMVLLCWLYLCRFGYSIRSSIVSGTLSWLFIFVLFWVAAANMGYTDWSILWITIPLSWLEMIIGSIIASRLYASGRWLKQVPV